MYDLYNNYSVQSLTYPFIKVGLNQNTYGDYFFQNPPIIQLCAPDEVFIWITNNDIVPNVIEHRYLISNYARIFDCYKNCFVNQVYNLKSSNYIVVYIYHYKDPFSTETKRAYLHRLVAYFFHYFPGCQNLQVNHINGIKTDNHACNLEWVTPLENIQHAFNMGLVPVGERSFNASITNKQVEEVCKLMEEGMNNKEIENLTGIPATRISEIRNKHIYTCVSKNFNIKPLKKMSPYLNDEIVHKICGLIVQGYPCNKIAKDVGCTVSQVKMIKYRGAYSHISKFYNFNDIVKKSGFGNRPIDEKIICKICKDLEKRDLTCKEISEKYKIQKNTVVNIKNGKIYKDISKNFNLPGREKKPRISTETAEKICKELSKKDGRSNKQIADDLSVNINSVKNLRRRSIFPDVNCNFDY